MTMFVHSEPAAILQRHAARRESGVPTVSLLVGPVEVSPQVWRRWATARGQRTVVADSPYFPDPNWIGIIAEELDLPRRAVKQLAQRANRDPEELLTLWPSMTSADRAWFWNSLAPETDDKILEAIANLAGSQASKRVVADLLSRFGDRIVMTILRLVPSEKWPTVLLVAGTADELAQVGSHAVSWVIRAPNLPLALAVPEWAWNEYLADAPESRVKSILGEGEIFFPVSAPVSILDTEAAERTLRDAGARNEAAVSLIARGGDAALVEAAVDLVRATADPPSTEADEDRARSAAERFLYLFLESLPETAGLFELNAPLDFRFGPRAAEVDLLCRSARIALELDGYFHFLSSDRYRRDRAKDWELQRRDYLVLRFLADDVIPQLETIRDRIFDAISLTRTGVEP